MRVDVVVQVGDVVQTNDVLRALIIWNGWQCKRTSVLDRFKGTTFFSGLLLVASLSLLFQLVFWGYEGGNRATTPDTAAYVEVTESIQDFVTAAGPLEGHIIRTPGYPLLIFIAAETVGVKISDATIVNRDWASTDDGGRAIVHRVIQLQAVLGFFIPLLIFLIVIALGIAVPLAVIASCAYFVDIPSVAFQFVVLNETLSLAVMLLTILAAIIALRKPSYPKLLAAGLVAGTAVLVRPPLAVLPLLLGLIAPLMLYHGGVAIRDIVAKGAVFACSFLVLPLCWSLVNLNTFDSLFLTKNGAYTLQNFSARHFVDLDIVDIEMSALQVHVRSEIQSRKERGVQQRKLGWYAMTESFDGVAADIGLDPSVPADIHYFMSLVNRANRQAILSNPKPFLHGGTHRWIDQWTMPLTNIKNRYVYARLAEFGPAGGVLAYQKRLIFGVATLSMLVILIPWACRYLPLREGAVLLWLAVFTVSYTTATALFDENEAIRHALQVRILVSVLLLVALGVIIPRLVQRVSALWSSDGQIIGHS